MATSAVVPSNGTVAAIPVKTETLNYAVVADTDENGKFTKYALTSSEKQISTIESSDYTEKMKAANKNPQVIVVKQAVSKPIVGTLDGFDHLFPAEKDKLFIINKGIDTHFGARLRANLLETNDKDELVFQFSDSPLDATKFIQQINYREKLSDEEEAAQALSKIPGVNADLIATIMAQIKAVQSGAQGQANISGVVAQ